MKKERKLTDEPETNACKLLFLADDHKSLGGIDYKNLNVKRRIISHLANGNAITADLCKLLNLSAPKVTEIINTLIKDNLVREFGKMDTNSGRKPFIYGLVPDSGFFIGVEVNNFHIKIGLLDFKKNLIKISEKIPFTLSNTSDSLNDLCHSIYTFIKGLSIKKEKILGIGVNLTGRINHRSGYSYSYFNFSEDPLSKIIEKQIGITTYLENDARAMAYGEFCNGVVQGEKNILFVDMDYGIGLGIIMNGEMYYGKSGFAGEFGHIPLFENEIICHCGKKGCLESEASGWALVRKFREKLKEGSSSIVTRKIKRSEDIKLEDIVDAARHDDVLSIELIAGIGKKLGRGIALLINLYNPELIVLGGIWL